MDTGQWGYDTPVRRLEGWKRHLAPVATTQNGGCRHQEKCHSEMDRGVNRSIDGQRSKLDDELEELRKEISNTRNDHSDRLNRLEDGFSLLHTKLDSEFSSLRTLIAKECGSGGGERVASHPGALEGTAASATREDVRQNNGSKDQNTKGGVERGIEEEGGVIQRTAGYGDPPSTSLGGRVHGHDSPRKVDTFKSASFNVFGKKATHQFLRKTKSNSLREESKNREYARRMKARRGTSAEDIMAKNKWISFQGRGASGLDEDSDEPSECLLGAQSSVFKSDKGGALGNREFSYRKNMRQALKASRRNQVGEKRKVKHGIMANLLGSREAVDEVISPDAPKLDVLAFAALDFKVPDPREENSSDGDLHPHVLENMADGGSARAEGGAILSPKMAIRDLDVFKFAALDFKVPDPRSRALGYQIGQQRKDNDYDGDQKIGEPTPSGTKRSQTVIGPGPVAEGDEQVPCILTNNYDDFTIPTGMVDNDSSGHDLSTVIVEDVDKGGKKLRLSISDSTDSVTDSDDFDEGWMRISSCLDWTATLFWDCLHPTGSFRSKWDFYMLLLFAYVCIVAPYIICFGVEFTRYSALGCIELIVDISFIVDIYFNFRTGFYDESNKLVLDRQRIAFTYMRTWLPVDLVSVIPFDEIVVNEQLGFVKLFKATRVVKLVKILRLLKIVKMLRVFKIPTLLRHLESAFGRGLLRLVSFMSAAILVTHLVACFFYYSAYLEGYGKDTWVSIGGLQGASNFDKYVTALYWSMSTLTTVGYGDVTPGNANEKIMSMVGMVVGVTVFAYFMGSMSAMMSSINSSNTRITRKLLAVEDFLRQRKVPPNLAERVRTFFNYILSRQIIVEETSIVNELSLPLRTELVLYLYREALEKLPFFQGKDPQFIVHIVTSLKLEYYAAGDVVVRQGDPGNMMYFIGDGRLEVRLYYEGNYDSEDDKLIGNPDMKVSEVPVTNLKPKKMGETHQNTLDLVNAWRNVSLFGPSESYQKLGVLHTGEYFGEYSCLLGECRTATVVAEEYCELYSLARVDLDEILEELPELGKEFLKMVEGYVKAGFGKNFLNSRIKDHHEGDTGIDSSQIEFPSLGPARQSSLHASSAGRRKSIVEKILEEQTWEDEDDDERPPPPLAGLGI